MTHDRVLSPTTRETAAFCAAVAEAVSEFVASRVASLQASSERLSDLVAGLDDDLAGGKMLRPTFCYWGWRAAGGRPDDPGVIGAAASLELLHASALVHDDVLDGSSTRRGRPSVHRRFAAQHVQRGWHGAAGPFGDAAAVLVGDLLLGWSHEALRTSGVRADRLGLALQTYDRMRDEVIGGQFLDMAAQASGSSDLGAALEVVELKSARYTVQRPLELGAVLAGGGPRLVAALTAYGRPVGTAFQLRDDLLGVLGDPTTTGKPVGDDLREGKRTVLLASAYELADAHGRATLDRLVGDPAIDEVGVQEIQTVVRGCGAEHRVESMISAARDDGLAVLETLPTADATVVAALSELAHAVSARTT